MNARSNLLHAGYSARALLMLAICVGLSGCIENTPLPGTPVAIPKSFTEAKPVQSVPVSSDWPRQFGSTELTRLSAQAQANNLDIAQAVARIRQAEAQTRISSSALYPTLSGASDASRTQSSGTSRSKVGPYNQTVNNQFDLTLNASYQFDFWGKNRDAAESAKLTADATAFDRDVIALATAATLASDYFQILAAQDRLNVARGNLRTAEHVLEAIKARLTVGTASALDIVSQETTVAQQRASIPPLQQTVEQTRNTIAVLLGRTPESLRVKGGSLNALRTPNPAAGVPSQLLLRRPDIAEAEAKLIAAGANIDVARKAFFPTITISAKEGLQSLLLKTLFRPESTVTSITAGLTQPIFDGYNLQGQLELQKGKQDELLAAYRKSIISAFSDVENALIAVRLTSEHEWLQANAVASSRKAYQITEERLREGTIDIVTLLTTQQTLFQSQDLLIQIRLQRFQAIVSLYQALGGGFTKPPVRPLPASGLLDLSVTPATTSATAQ